MNPRYPFGVHTISSRARYDHFDTAPYGCCSDSLCMIARFAKFVKRKFRKSEIHSSAQVDLIKKKRCKRIASFIWRSRRDLNPRYPFGVHTISSRARYDHFDTAPCGVAIDLFIITHRHRFVKNFFIFIFRVAICRMMRYNRRKRRCFL